MKNALDEFSLYSYFRAVKAEARTNVPLFEGGTYTVDELHAAQFMVVVDSDNADPTDHVKVFESTGKILHEYVRSYRWQLLDEKDEDSEEGEDANLDQIIERERASDPIILVSPTLKIQLVTSKLILSPELFDLPPGYCPFGSIQLSAEDRKCQG